MIQEAFCLNGSVFQWSWEWILVCWNKIRRTVFDGISSTNRTSSKSAYKLIWKYFIYISYLSNLRNCYVKLQMKNTYSSVKFILGLRTFHKSQNIVNTQFPAVELSVQKISQHVGSNHPCSFIDVAWLPSYTSG